MKMHANNISKDASKHIVLSIVLNMRTQYKDFRDFGYNIAAQLRAFAFILPQYQGLQCYCNHDRKHNLEPCSYTSL